MIKSQKNSKFLKLLFFTAFAGSIILFAVLYIHNVSREITKQDLEYIEHITEFGGYDFADLQNPPDFEAQIATIRAVQDSILAKTPEQERIALNTPREPKNLYALNHALCGDRSRFMDKALRAAGMQARFAFVYMTSKITSPVKAFLSRDKSKVRSHAVVEVKTEKGWIVVDSVERWIGLDANGTVYSLEDIRNYPDIKNIEWDAGNSGQIYFILEDDFAYLYGLYSRNGRLYPPYNSIPDINWPEFMLNF